MQRHDVLTVGGGVVGLTAALTMALRDFDVALIDAADLKAEPKTSLRVYAINQSSKQLLEQLGVWSLLDAKEFSPYQHMHIWDAATASHIEFDARTIARPNLGYIVYETHLKNALLKRLQTMANVSFYSQHKVTAIEVVDRQVTLQSEKALFKGRLLMVADGALSPIREQLKVATTSWSYQQHAVIATVKTQKPHEKTAWQVFLKDGPLAFLPLADAHECSIVWSTRPRHAQTLCTMATEEFNEALTRAFSQKLGQVQLTSERRQFPLIMRHARQYVGQNWLLLGDAAHTFHPLAGQGLNVGLADVSAYAACLDKAGLKLESKQALHAYQRQRRHAVWQTIVLMEGLKRAFETSFTPLALLRGLGMKWCNQLAPLKRLFIAHAAGEEFS